MKERNIISIDLKSFFASVECVSRNYDPYKVALVVSDISRGNGAITLAVSPYLRNLGVKSRCRVFELPKNIKIIYAKPRMKLYQEYSNKILDIYKEFISEDDIHVYSIDEVFIDVTDYLKYYNKSDYEIALMIMNEIKRRTGITSTAGIGPNIYLAKVAMDIEAKHNKDCIAKWTFNDIETKLWNIQPLSKVWGIGNRLELKLNNLGIKKVKDINNYSRDFYIKRFGNVIGNDIWCKANGIDFTTIKDLNSKEKDKSMSMSQILNRDYDVEETLLIVKEMNDLLNEKLRKMKLNTKLIHLGITYSRDFHLGFHQTISLNESTDDRDEIFKVMKYIYEKNIEDLPIRKVSIAYSNLSKKENTQLSIFTYEKKSNNNEYYELIDKINDKFGRTTLLRASSLLSSSTIKEREKFKNMN